MEKYLFDFDIINGNPEDYENVPKILEENQLRVLGRPVYSSYIIETEEMPVKKLEKALKDIFRKLNMIFVLTHLRDEEYVVGETAIHQKVNRLKEINAYVENL